MSLEFCFRVKRKPARPNNAINLGVATLALSSPQRSITTFRRCDRWLGLPSQPSSCCFDPGFCLPKPWSVVLYRALAIAETPFECRVVVNHIQTSQRCFLQCQFSTDLNVAFRLLIHALNSVHRNPVPLFCTAGRRFANNQILTRILVSHGSGPAESHFHIGRNSQFCVLFQSRVKTCNLGRI